MLNEALAVKIVYTTRCTTTLVNDVSKLSHGVDAPLLVFFILRVSLVGNSSFLLRSLDRVVAMAGETKEAARGAKCFHCP